MATETLNDNKEDSPLPPSSPKATEEKDLELTKADVEANDEATVVVEEEVTEEEEEEEETTTTVTTTTTITESSQKKRKAKKEDKDKDPVTPSLDRPTRERKVVERYSAPTTPRSATPKALSIGKGSGTQLREIPNVAFKLSKRKPDDNLQLLHTILFGKKAKAHSLKKNIGQFSGFVWAENEEKQKSKVKEKLDKCVKDKLLDFCEVLNIPVNKAAIKKEELSVKLLEFLESPHPTTEVLLAEKEQKGKKRKVTPSKKVSAIEDASSKKRKQTSQTKEKQKDASKVEEEDEDDEKVDSPDDKDKMDEDLDVDEATAKEESDNEETKSEEEKEVEEEEEDEEEETKEQKSTKKSSVEKNVKEAKSKEKPATGKKSTSVKAKEKAKGLSSKRNSTDTDTDEKAKAKTSSSKKQKVEKESSTKEKSVPKKDKSSGKKQATKSPPTVPKSQGKAKKKGKEPTREEMHAVVVSILKEVDFNTATLSDILRQLGTHFGVDLMARKAEVKEIITEVINNMSDEEEEDNEEAGDETEAVDKDGDGEDDA